MLDVPIPAASSTAVLRLQLPPQFPDHAPGAYIRRSWALMHTPLRCSPAVYSFTLGRNWPKQQRPALCVRRRFGVGRSTPLVD